MASITFLMKVEMMIMIKMIIILMMMVVIIMLWLTKEYTPKI